MPIYVVNVTRWVPVSASSQEEAEKLAASTPDLRVHDRARYVVAHTYIEGYDNGEVVPLGERQGRTIRQILEAERRADAIVRDFGPALERLED